MWDEQTSLKLSLCLLCSLSLKSKMGWKPSATSKELLDLKFVSSQDFPSESDDQVKRCRCDALISVQHQYWHHLSATDSCLEFHTDVAKCVCTRLRVYTQRYMFALFAEGGTCSVTHWYSVYRSCECVCVSGCRWRQRKCGTGKCWTSTEGILQ